ncbi:MAG: FMN-binding protein [Clostridia bacterium]|nr:FMN-binding protein [Clostridia bacterium]
MAKHIAKIRKTGRIGIAVAVVVLVAAIVTVAVIVANRDKKVQSFAAFLETVHTYQDLELEKDAKPVTAVQKCSDTKGKTVAYAVTAYGEGFADKVSVRCFFSLNKKTLLGVQVVQHSETKDIGDKAATSVYTQQFERKKMPLWFNDGSVPETELPKQEGTRVDTVTGATVSCRAIIEAVNAAYIYYVDMQV